MFEPHKVEIEERDGKYWLKIDAPLDVKEPAMSKTKSGTAKYVNFLPDEMKPSASGKTFKLWDLGKGDNFSCRHPLTGESLLLSARLTMGMSEHDERRQALMRYALERGQ